MKGFIRKITRPMAIILVKSRYRRSLYLLILLGFALYQGWMSDSSRRTFVFYNRENLRPAVEDRMVPRGESTDTDIRRYIEEALLGPVSPDQAPLFSRGVRLHSFIYRNGVVYADLSADASLPPVEGGNLSMNCRTLIEGIKRNFRAVREVRLFIAGNEAYYEENQG